MDKEIVCPVCGGKCQEVKSSAVKHMVKEEYAKDVADKTYFVCMNEACDVVYFDEDVKYCQKDLCEPIWFKKDADPKYICYCNRVTEQMIFDAVINDGAKDMKDIVRLTGAMKNGKCETNNPLGKCCGPVILETIAKALKMKEE